MKGATSLSGSRKRPNGVSIHAPNEGSDPLGAGVKRIRVVSIHAPNEGSDLVIWQPQAS